MRIEIWSDVVCPWCFVGKRRLEAALARFDHADEVEVVHRSFELDPTAPQHGTELSTGVIARRYGRTEDEMRDMQQQLIDLAAEAGLDPARVAEVLAGHEYADAVEADVAQARAFGATGVPFFVVDRRYAVSGAQPAAVFERLLQQAWAESHPVPS